MKTSWCVYCNTPKAVVPTQHCGGKTVNTLWSHGEGSAVVAQMVVHCTPLDSYFMKCMLSCTSCRIMVNCVATQNARSRL